MSIAKIFIPNFVCVVQMKDTNYQTGFLFCHLGRAAGAGLWGDGAAQGGQFFFSNMVMWHIKSTGMRSRTKGK